LLLSQIYMNILLVFFILKFFKRKILGISIVLVKALTTFKHT